MVFLIFFLFAFLALLVLLLGSRLQQADYGDIPYTQPPSVALMTATAAKSFFILSTSLTTVLGFLPLLYFSGGQFWPPLAVMMAGGVGFSVILALWLTPVFYYWLAKNGGFVAEKA